MSDAAFAELQTKVKSLPLYQVKILWNQLSEIMAENDQNESDKFVFDSLVNHTERADRADDYIREFRNNDRF
ncbi:MAG: hypothetical protein IKQ84_10275 [Spirochaetaceae bacterium]|nr:hypothetical protein [Spirochaetaceae bacterium]